MKSFKDFLKEENDFIPIEININEESPKGYYLYSDNLKRYLEITDFKITKEVGELIYLLTLGNKEDFYRIYNDDEFPDLITVYKDNRLTSKQKYNEIEKLKIS